MADFCNQPRLYTVQTEQGLLRRDLRKSAERPPLFIPLTDDNAVVPMRLPQLQDVRLPELPLADIEPPELVVHPEHQQTLAIKQDVAVL